MLTRQPQTLKPNWTSCLRFLRAEIKVCALHVALSLIVIYLIQMKQQDKHIIINDFCLQVPIFLGKWKVREECLKWASQGNTFLLAATLGVMSLGLFASNGARQGYHCWCSPQFWEWRVAMFSSSHFSIISLLKACILEGLDVRHGGFGNQESGL